MRSLRDTGLNCVWVNQCCTNLDLGLFKQTVKDQAKQMCQSNQELSNRKRQYFNLKTHWGPETYLLQLDPKYYFTLIKFKLSNHNLPVERGRYDNVPYEERFYEHCPSMLGDEYHYVMECPTFLEIRKKNYFLQIFINPRRLLNLKNCLPRQTPASLLNSLI